METALELVPKLSDAQLVQVARELFNIVYSHLPYNQVKNNFEGQPEVERLASLDQEMLKQELPTGDSARLGRLVLEQYAHNPSLAPFVLEAWDKVRSSDKLVVDVILALGLLVNLTLLVTTTKVQVQKDANGHISWVAIKEFANPGQLKAVIDPFLKLAKVAQ
jgi:hypothetical protein